MENSVAPACRLETERYRAILQAAERLFVEKGYHTVSVEQIADTAGVSKGLVHYHFNSKEQLLFCILKDILDDLLTRLDAISKRDDPARVKIQMAIKEYMDLVKSRSGLARVTFFEEALTEKTRSYISGMAETNILNLIGLVEEGIAKGEFRDVNSRLVSSLITGVILEVMREAVLQQRELRTGELAAEITSILCEGISL